jgi:predicted metal-dependent enzyme (double-stranded beta helix superfamily)
MSKKELLHLPVMTILNSKLQNVALDFYQGNIGAANSKYFSILDELSKYEPFLKNAKNVLKLQENEDWVGLADIFYEMSQ